MRRINTHEFEPKADLDPFNRGVIETEMFRQIHESRFLISSIIFEAETTNRLRLVTTRYDLPPGREPFAALFWIQNIYYRDQASRVLRMEFVPITEPCGPNQFPPLPKREQGYRFTFHETEALWAVVLLARTCIDLGLNQGVPPHQSESLRACILNPPRYEFNPLWSESDELQTCWTDLARSEYERWNNSR